MSSKKLKELERKIKAFVFALIDAENTVNLTIVIFIGITLLIAVNMGNENIVNLLGGGLIGFLGGQNTKKNGGGTDIK